MANTFDASRWHMAVQNLDPNLIIKLRWQANYIVGELPTNYGSDNIAAIATELSEVRESIANARRLSSLPDFWPDNDATDDELLLGLTGLSNFSILPQNRRRQTSSPARSS